MTPETFAAVVRALGQQGEDDIEWSESCGAPESAGDFAEEAIFVICNSGMKNTVARLIYDRVMAALADGRSASTAFGHKLKARAIDTIWANQLDLYLGYLGCVTEEQKLIYLDDLPHIGGITKYHLAKNFGVDVPKPDVHLQRLADHYGETVMALCQRLSVASGLAIRTVDVVLWRACATGLIDSRTASFHPQEGKR
jgi:hypothetical protein